MGEEDDLRAQIEEMLRERGIDQPDRALKAFPPGSDYDAALGAVKYYDDLPHTGDRAVGPGLLVKKLQEGGMPGYKRQDERAQAKGTMSMSPQRVGNIRSACLSSDGVTRADASMMFSRLALTLKIPVTSIIATAMGESWEGTPPHPGSRSWNHTRAKREKLWDWEKPPEHPVTEAARYDDMVQRRPRPRPHITRGVGENDWDFAYRFWGYADPVLPGAEKRAEWDARIAGNSALAGGWHPERQIKPMSEGDLPPANAKQSTPVSTAKKDLAYGDPGPVDGDDGAPW